MAEKTVGVDIDEGLHERARLAAIAQKVPVKTLYSRGLAIVLDEVDKGLNLTEDQRDILALLAEDPKRDFLFSSLQTTVKHALEQYRTKWKPKKAAKPRFVDERRPTGTGPAHRR